MRGRRVREREDVSVFLLHLDLDCSGQRASAGGDVPAERRCAGQVLVPAGDAGEASAWSAQVVHHRGADHGHLQCPHSQVSLLVLVTSVCLCLFSVSVFIGAWCCRLCYIDPSCVDHVCLFSVSVFIWAWYCRLYYISSSPQKSKEEKLWFSKILFSFWFVVKHLRNLTYTSRFYFPEVRIVF